MKLDHDLIRKILVSVEEISDGHKNFPPGYLAEEYLSDYDLSVVEYHVKQLTQARLLECPNGYIIDLSFEGHQYFSNIRSDTVWKKTKETIAPLGGVTLGIVTEVAKKYILKELHL